MKRIDTGEYDHEDAFDDVVQTLLQVEPMLLGMQLGLSEKVDFDVMADAAQLVERMASLRAGKPVKGDEGIEDQNVSFIAKVVLLVKDNPEFQRFNLEEISEMLSKSAGLGKSDPAVFPPRAAQNARQFVLWLMDIFKNHEGTLLGE